MGIWRLGREVGSELIARFIAEGNGKTRWLFSDTSIGMNRDVEYLPDCTGFDWKPSEPPPGYRLLKPKEKVRNWDMGLKRNGTWIELLGDPSGPVEVDQLAGHIYARKIEPQYRPFANAAEFAPHFNRVVQWVKDKQSFSRVHTYHESCVWVAVNHLELR